MADLIKRLHYFTNEFLLQEDFTAEQLYHMSMRRMHNKVFHGFGVGSGLVVSRSADQQVRITAGTAIDRQGREIVLVDDVTYDLRNSTPTLYLYVVYAEGHRAEDNYSHGGVSDNTRWSEVPQILESPNVLPPDDGNNVVLAKISLNNNIPAAITNVDTSVAPRAAVSVLAPNSVTTDAILANAVSNNKLAADAVQRNVIKPGEVLNAALASDAVQRNVIKPGEVLNAALASDAVQRNVIKAGEVLNAALASDAVQRNVIKPGEVLNAALASDAVQRNVIKGGEVLNAALASDAVQRNVIKGGEVLNEALASDAVQNNVIKDGTIGFVKLAIVGSRTDTAIVLAPLDSRDFTLTVDSAAPQFLFVSVRPTTLGGSLSVTQKSITRQTASTNQKVDYTVTVKNLGGDDVTFTIKMQTIAAA